MKKYELVLTYDDGYEEFLELEPGQKTLRLARHRNLRSISGALPPTLEDFNCSCCYALESIPELPVGLKFLSLYECASLKNLPELPPKLEKLTFTTNKYLVSIAQLPTTLTYLNLSDSWNLKELPALPPRLEGLKLSFCGKLSSLPPLPSPLRELRLSHCRALKSLPTLPSRLEELMLFNCEGLKELPEMPRTLKCLELNGCTGLRNCPAELKGIRSAALSEAMICGDEKYPWLAIIELCEYKRKSIHSLKPETIAKYIRDSVGVDRGYLILTFGVRRFAQYLGVEECTRLILAVENVELRRMLIEEYGWQQFMFDAGAQIVHEDDFGVLYKLRLKYDHPLAMVKVVNATREKDGSFKDYCLMVHWQTRPMFIDDQTKKISFGKPQKQTARNAVASTFGMRGEEYSPEVET